MLDDEVGVVETHQAEFDEFDDVDEVEIDEIFVKDDVMPHIIDDEVDDEVGFLLVLLLLDEDADVNE